jgi:hypothetical protein
MARTKQCARNHPKTKWQRWRKLMATLHVLYARLDIDESCIEALEPGESPEDINSDETSTIKESEPGEPTVDIDMDGNSNEEVKNDEEHDSVEEVDSDEGVSPIKAFEPAELTVEFDSFLENGNITIGNQLYPGVSRLLTTALLSTETNITEDSFLRGLIDPTFQLKDNVFDSFINGLIICEDLQHYLNSPCNFNFGVNLLDFGNTCKEQSKKRKREEMEAKSELQAKSIPEAEANLDKSPDPGAAASDKETMPILLDTRLKDVLSAVAHFILFSKVIVKCSSSISPNNPTIINWFLELIHMVSAPEAVIRLDEISKEKPYVYHSIFLIFQNLFAEFGSVIYHTMQSLHTFQSLQHLGNKIHTPALFKSSLTFFYTAKHNLNDCINGAAVTKPNDYFTTEPPTFHGFGPIIEQGSKGPLRGGRAVCAVFYARLDTDGNTIVKVEPGEPTVQLDYQTISSLLTTSLSTETNDTEDSFMRGLFDPTHQLKHRLFQSFVDGKFINKDLKHYLKNPSIVYKNPSIFKNDMSLLAFGDVNIVEPIKEPKKKKKKAESKSRAKAKAEAEANLDASPDQGIVAETASIALHTRLKDVLSAVIHFILFSNIIVNCSSSVSPNNPTIINWFLELVFIVSAPEAVIRLDEISKEKPYIYHSIFLVFQNLLAQFGRVTRQTVEALKKPGCDLSPALYESALTFFQTTKQNLSDCINGATITMPNDYFTTEPPTYLLFCPISDRKKKARRPKMEIRKWKKLRTMLAVLYACHDSDEYSSEEFGNYEPGELTVELESLLRNDNICNGNQLYQEVSRLWTAYLSAETNPIEDSFLRDLCDPAFELNNNLFLSFIHGRLICKSLQRYLISPSFFFSNGVSLLDFGHTQSKKQGRIRQREEIEAMSELKSMSEMEQNLDENPDPGTAASDKETMSISLDTRLNDVLSAVVHFIFFSKVIVNCSSSISPDNPVIINWFLELVHMVSAPEAVIRLDEISKEKPYIYHSIFLIFQNLFAQFADVSLHHMDEQEISLPPLVYESTLTFFQTAKQNLSDCIKGVAVTMPNDYFSTEPPTYRVFDPIIQNAKHIVSDTVISNMTNMAEESNRSPKERWDTLMAICNVFYAKLGIDENSIEDFDEEESTEDLDIHEQYSIRGCDDGELTVELESLLRNDDICNGNQLYQEVSRLWTAYLSAETNPIEDSFLRELCDPSFELNNNLFLSFIHGQLIFQDLRHYLISPSILSHGVSLLVFGHTQSKKQGKIRQREEMEAMSELISMSEMEQNLDENPDPGTAASDKETMSISLDTRLKDVLSAVVHFMLFSRVFIYFSSSISPDNPVIINWFLELIHMVSAPEAVIRLDEISKEKPYIYHSIFLVFQNLFAQFADVARIAIHRQQTWVSHHLFDDALEFFYTAKQNLSDCIKGVAVTMPNDYFTTEPPTYRVFDPILQNDSKPTFSDIVKWSTAKIEESEQKRLNSLRAVLAAFYVRLHVDGNSIVKLELGELAVELEFVLMHEAYYNSTTLYQEFCRLTALSTEINATDDSFLRELFNPTTPLQSNFFNLFIEGKLISRDLHHHQHISSICDKEVSLLAFGMLGIKKHDQIEAKSKASATGLKDVLSAVAHFILFSKVLVKCSSSISPNYPTIINWFLDLLHFVSDPETVIRLDDISKEKPYIYDSIFLVFENLFAQFGRVTRHTIKALKKTGGYSFSPDMYQSALTFFQTAKQNLSDCIKGAAVTVPNDYFVREPPTYRAFGPIIPVDSKPGVNDTVNCKKTTILQESNAVFCQIIQDDLKPGFSDAVNSNKTNITTQESKGLPNGTWDKFRAFLSVFYARLDVDGKSIVKFVPGKFTVEIENLLRNRTIKNGTVLYDKVSPLLMASSTETTFSENSFLQGLFNPTHQLKHRLFQSFLNGLLICKDLQKYLNSPSIFSNEVSLLAFGKTDMNLKEQSKKRKREEPSYESKAKSEIEQNNDGSPDTGIAATDVEPIPIVPDTCLKDVLSAVVHFIFFSKVLVKCSSSISPDNPAIINWFLELVDMVSAPEAVIRLDEISKEKPYIYHSIFLVFQNLLAQFGRVIRPSNHTIAALQQGSFLPPASYQSALTFFQTTKQNLSDCINGAAVTKPNDYFTTEPPTYRVFGSGKKSS